MQLDGIEFWDVLDVVQGRRKGCVLEPLMFNTFITAVQRVTEKRFIAYAAIIDSMVQKQRKEERGRRRGRDGLVEPTSGETTEIGAGL